MTTRRYAVLLALVTAAFATAVIAAFGSGSASAGAEARAKGAVAVPATALAYASVNLDRSGTQFSALEALAAKVDGGAAAVDRLNAMLDGTGQQARIVRALGGDVSVGLVGVTLTNGATPGVEAVVVATAADGSALPGVLAKAGFTQGPAIAGQPVWENGATAVTIDGSTVIGATSRATLAEALAVQAGQRPSLADDPAFKTTIAKLPGDAVAVAYIAPARLSGILQAASALLPKGAMPKGAPDMTQSLAQLSATLKDVRGLGIALTAESGGLRVIAAGDADTAALERLGARFPTAYAPGILAQVPADALGFGAFRDLGPTLVAAITAGEAQDPQVASMVAAFEQATGVTLDGLGTALAGEHVVLAEGGDAPGAALLTQPADAKGANMILSNALAAARDAMPAGGKDGAAKLDALALTQSGGTIAIGTLPNAAATPNASITESAAYRAIADRAGVPAEVTALGYVNVAQLRAEARAKGMPLPAGTDALNGVIAWGTADGASLFLSVG